MPLAAAITANTRNRVFESFMIAPFLKLVCILVITTGCVHAVFADSRLEAFHGREGRKSYRGACRGAR